MKRMKMTLGFLLFLLLPLAAQTGNEKTFQTWAITPPMGWNSWDCFGPSVVEDEVKANADYMAENLLEYGWEYVVVDIRWYIDNQTTGHYNKFDKSDFIYDEYGRYMPSPKRFPSAADGAGFKPLADYVHAQGLKFGIHIMRGVPKKAVSEKLPILGTDKTAADIYSTEYECTWLQDNYTIVAGKEGAQEYYNSIFDLYASWGVDYVKVDDLSRPYHDKEIEMIRKAIDQSGRPMVLSMSPGATPVDQHAHARDNANLWRTIDDFWDNWSQLNYSFGVCADWAPYIAPGGWPDADMLPMGKFIRGERATNRYTNFTADEQYTLMTLWSIFRSPLMFGGNMPDNDDFTNMLLTNKEVLAMHSLSVNNKQWFHKNDVTAWTADDPTNGDKFLALFNNGGDGFVNTKHLLYRSGTVSMLTDGYGEHIDLEIPEGSSMLYLIANDGGDNYACDHANWIAPTIYLSNGDSILLTDLKWEYATTNWGEVQVNKSITGKPLNIKGTEYANGLGTHARSIIAYSIPENTVRFKTFAGLDNVGTTQGCGSTIEFMVANQDPTMRDVNTNNAIANSGRVSRTLHNEGVNLTADITGAEKLYLVVTDAGDNKNFDHGNWIFPTIYKANGDSMLLTEMDWASATSGWASVQKNKSLDGNPLTVNGKTYKSGFGVNSYSTIEFDLPEGYTTFKSFCGIDDEVLKAAEGVTMEFMVFTTNPAKAEVITIPVDLEALGFSGECTIRDMWEGEDVGTYEGSEFVPAVNEHGAKLYRISAGNRSDAASITFTTSSTKKKGDTPVKMEVKVASTENVPASGWIQIYEDEKMIANIELDKSGSAVYELKSATPGKHNYSAVYGGDQYYAPKTSESIGIKVK